MSNVFTLESLRDELETKYGSFVFQAGKQKFELPPLLRLPESERDVAFDLIRSSDEVQESGDLKEMQVLFENLIRVLTRDGKGDALLDIVDHDLLAMQVLIQKWTEKTQPGEA